MQGAAFPPLPPPKIWIHKQLYKIKRKRLRKLSTPFILVCAHPRPALPPPSLSTLREEGEGTHLAAGKYTHMHLDMPFSVCLALPGAQQGGGGDAGAGGGGVRYARFKGREEEGGWGRGEGVYAE